MKSRKDMTEIKLPEYILEIIERLEAAGFKAYAVGGCVRDSVMGREPSDYDVTASASPEQTMSLFQERRLLTHGVKHGTVTVMCGTEPVEITTFRRDGEYSDSRHPDAVYFDATLEQDLARRDFTCNAMAYSPHTGIVDIFGGRQDIEKCVIRAVGNPERRFNEDALRIMRALRFASVLGFSVEDETARAAVNLGSLLENVSAERKFSELCRLLCGQGCRTILTGFPEILEYAVPGVLKMKSYDQHNPYHTWDLLEHTARVTENVPPVPHMRLAALLHDIGKPDCQTAGSDGNFHFYGHPQRSAELADDVLKTLRCDNSTREKVIQLIENHDIRLQPDRKLLRRLLGRLGTERLRELFQLQRADILAQNPALLDRLDVLEQCRCIAEEEISRKSCCTVASLEISGDDVIAAGIPQGTCVGRVLNALLDEVCDGRLPNERGVLLARVAELAKKV